MKHWQTILVRVLWSIAGAALIVLFVVAWKAKEEKRCTSIQIELVGENTAALFMDEKEILQIIHEQGVKEGMPIGDLNLNTLEKYLQTIRWVKNVELFLDNTQSLQVRIEQRTPIARIFTASGNSFYIDKEGLQLPLKQLTVLRLPVFTNFPSDQEKLSKPDSLLLNDVLHFTQAVATDSFFMAQTAQVNIANNGDFELVPSVGDHLVLIGSVENIEDKLNRLYTFYKKVWVQSGLNAYQVIDCRFDNQIVALKKGMQPIQFSANDLPTVDSVMAIEMKLDTTSNRAVNVTEVKPATLNASKTSVIASPKTVPVTNPKLAPKTVVKSPTKTTVKTPSKPAVKPATKKGSKNQAKTSSKSNNKSKSKSLIKVKQSAKALMPQKKASTTNN
ncbi:MAG: cell division protein FtsQ/DivIB [Chitinophagaceae bacterium]|nr:cell division protein FtsQ/DivIB [Chitinophagaceae bacterium]